MDDDDDEKIVVEDNFVLQNNEMLRARNYQSMKR